MKIRWKVELLTVMQSLVSKISLEGPLDLRPKVEDLATQVFPKDSRWANWAEALRF